MLFVVLVSVLFALLCVIELKKFYLNRTKLKNFNQFDGFPIIGSGYKFIGRKNDDLFKQFTRIYSQQFPRDTIKYDWYLNKLVVVIDDPNDLKLCLNSDKCIDKPFVYDYFSAGQGIFNSKKQVWKPHRRALNPTLSPKMVSSFIPIFNEKFKITADQMERYIGQNVDLHRPMFKASAEAIVATQCGVSWPLQTQRGDELYDLLDEWFNCVQARVVRFWLSWDFLYKFTHRFTRESSARTQLVQFINSTYEIKKVEIADKLNRSVDVLEQRRESNSLNYIEKCMLLEREGKFTLDDVYEELLTVFVGATDTSSTVLSTTILMLAIHQEYQERVFAELREMFANVDDYVTADHIANMKFLELVIKESIRLFPAAPISGRETDDDLPIRDGVIPKGATLLVSSITLHRNKKYWGENAELFYPERFLPENFENIHPYTFNGFSGGPRNCIGAKYAWFSLKITLAYLLRRFRFETDLKLEDIVIKPSIVLKILNKDPVRIERRQW